MIDWPEEVVTDIARRRCVLFLGAGVSKNSTNDQGVRPADWLEFLQGLANDIDGEERAAVDQCIANGDLLTACEVARDALRVAAFESRLLAAFSEKRFRPSPVHTDLVEIDSRIVLTTNFDKIYENAANSILHGDILVKTYLSEDLADIIRRQNRCILKVHGSIDSPREAILTRTDYARMRSKHADFYRILDALFMTHTFVFLGASMTDPDVRLLLEDYARRYPGTRPHYVVSPAGATPAPIVKVIESSMNLRTISYNPQDNHRELSEGIAQLKNLVNESRSGLLTTMNW
ncbi:SIR2 family protein [Dyella amyloliquefaciens]|uniref:SIR2 family protein n=1 Tax=Dyella amyloliquefaciens TaxID=1770545 RepID=UPI00102EBC41|nr:SIR2 family protein [Dyella amyloliquefaciens]